MSRLDTAATDPGPEQRRWIDAAQAAIDPELLARLVRGMVDIPSPTGEEAPLARWLVESIAGLDIPARLQPLDDHQANAVARMGGDGTGASLLLYAPIDTLTTGTADEDVPWVGPDLRPDMQASAVQTGEHISGLGASNPKGHGACVIAAAAAIRAAGVPLRGDLVLGLGAGGMPTNARERAAGSRRNTGQGVGCSFMLEQGIWTDYAVIAKPGFAVAWEEVGLCWFDVTIQGTFSYVGSRHRMPYRNPIVEAGSVVAGLERWFVDYTRRHTDGLVAPQANIGAIEGGWWRMASVSPAACRLRVDVRVSPRATPAQVSDEFGAAIARLRSEQPDVQLDWEMVLAIPGTATPASSWIVGAAIEGWTATTGRPHEPIAETSGATDANILRSRGIPTARVGMDRIGSDAPIPLDFPAGMNVVDLREALRLTRHLVHTAVNTVTRPIDWQPS